MLARDEPDSLIPADDNPRRFCSGRHRATGCDSPVTSACESPLSSMRIDYLARRPLPSRDANSVQIAKMCEAFAQNGHKVRLFVVPGDGPPQTVFERYGVKPIFDLVTLGRPPFPKAAFLRELVARLGKSPQADLFFGRDIVSLACAARSNKPVIYEAHAMPPRFTARWWVLKWLFGQTNFSHLVCVTSTLADQHRQQFKALDGKPILVVPNAAADVLEGTSARPRSTQHPRLQVGLVSRPFPGKGIEAVIEAARELDDIDFHVVGAAESDLCWITSPLPANLKLHGYVPHAELNKLYEMFDVAVAPYGASVMNASGVESAAITSPLKLLEYMAAGLPIIVSDLPGVRDILGDADFAVRIPPGDHRAFIAAVHSLSNDPDLRRSMGQAARRAFEDCHTVTARSQAVLGELASTRRSDEDIR